MKRREFLRSAILGLAALTLAAKMRIDPRGETPRWATNAEIVAALQSGRFEVFSGRCRASAWKADNFGLGQYQLSTNTLRYSILTDAMLNPKTP